MQLLIMIMLMYSMPGVHSYNDCQSINESIKLAKSFFIFPQLHTRRELNKAEYVESKFPFSGGSHPSSFQGRTYSLLCLTTNIFESALIFPTARSQHWIATVRSPLGNRA